MDKNEKDYFTVDDVIHHDLSVPYTVKSIHGLRCQPFPDSRRSLWNNRDGCNARV